MDPFHFSEHTPRDRLELAGEEGKDAFEKWFGVGSWAVFIKDVETWPGRYGLKVRSDGRLWDVERSDAMDEEGIGKDRWANDGLRKNRFLRSTKM